MEEILITTIVGKIGSLSFTSRIHHVSLKIEQVLNFFCWWKGANSVPPIIGQPY